MMRSLLLYGEVMGAEKLFASEESGTFPAWLQAVIGESEKHEIKPAANGKEGKERDNARQTWLICASCLQLYRNRRGDGQAVRGDGTFHGQDLHTCGGSPAQGIPEGGVSDIVGGEVLHAAHLQNKADGSLVAFRPAESQLLQMFDAPQGGSVGKAGVALVLQGDTLDLHKAFAACGVLPVKIKAGVPPHRFRAQQRQPGTKLPGPGPLAKYTVGSLGVHIDHQGTFLHRNKIVAGLAVGVVAQSQIYRCSGDQQFPAAPGVFYMNNFLNAVQQYFGDEPVGP